MAKIYKQVAELGDIITGKTPSTANEQLWGGAIPFITPTDIKGYDTFYQQDTERTISQLGANKQKKTLLPKNSICVTCIGSTIGKSCLTKVPSITNQQINSIIPNSDNDYRYVHYLVRENLSYLQLIGGGSGSGTPIISKNKFVKFKFLVEDNFSIQQKIASILSTYDTLIENNTKRIRLLEQMAENLYKEWFVRFRFPGHEKVEMENGLPKGWKVGKINEIAEINPLRILKKGETATCLDMGNMPTSGSFPIDWECKQYNGGAKFQNGDVLIARITPCLENGKIAYVYFLKDNEVAFGSTEYIVLAPKSNMISPFLYCMCRTNHFISYASNGMVGASGRQRVSGEVIGKYELIIPPMQILKDIKPLLDSFFYQIKLLSIQNQLLTRQRDLLLPRLMSGKLEVTV